MRLWHKDLIPYLPRKQLIAQWRECCAICSNIANKGRPNHLLVDKIMVYSAFHFLEYTRLIIEEMKKRNFEVNEKSYENFVRNFDRFGDSYETSIGVDFKPLLFRHWHNDRYLKQCLFNLQEKYDCGEIPEEEWKVIENHFGEYLD